MFGSVVLAVDKDRYQEILTAARLRSGIKKVSVFIYVYAYIVIYVYLYIYIYA
jgi:hypothetical protein